MQFKRFAFIAIMILAAVALTALPAAAQLQLPSDDFSAASLGAHWIADPLSPNPTAPTESVSVADGRLHLLAPANTRRDLRGYQPGDTLVGADGNIQAPRVLQAVSDPKNFTITVKLDDLPNDLNAFGGAAGIVLKGKYDLPGTAAVEQYDAYLRSSVDTDREPPYDRLFGIGFFFWKQPGSGTPGDWVVPVKMINGPEKTRLSVIDSRPSIWLRLTRRTDAVTGQSIFRMFWSKNGKGFKEFLPLSSAASCGGPCNVLKGFTVTHIGVFSATFGTKPASLAQFDDFIYHNTAIEVTATPGAGTVYPTETMDPTRDPTYWPSVFPTPKRGTTPLPGVPAVRGYLPNIYRR